MSPSPPRASIGQRLSFRGETCTVRYIGNIEGQGEKVWLGVEWDNELRGKHSGTYNGKQYFRCLSSSPNAASFIQSAGRKPDPELSFLEAIQQKYVSEATHEQYPVRIAAQIEISGKVVEEVGFDKIREQISKLDSLKIIILTNQRINTASKVGENAIATICPLIELIDLTGNLIHSFKEVVAICEGLPRLKTLKLNENRFIDLGVSPVYSPKATWPPSTDHGSTDGPFELYRIALACITNLEMQNVLLPWDALQRTMSFFPSLESFDGSRNQLIAINPGVTSFGRLTSLVLDHNGFTTLSSITPLSEIQSLQVLRLKANKIATVQAKGETLVPIRPFPICLRYVDLSSNLVCDWDFVNSLPTVFPGLTELRFSGNPIYGITSMSAGMSSAAEDSYMLTVAMLGGLTSLNFSKISLAERANAEMFYLSKVGKQIADLPPDQEDAILFKHRRYHELCQIHGAPTIVRREAGDINPRFLDARLLTCNFYLAANSCINQADIVRVMKEIPKSFDIYRVKGIVGQLLGIQPLSFNLIWETGEWDPVAGYDDEEESDDESDVDFNGLSGHDSGRMISREVRLEDGTRPIGNWVDGLEATIRVEISLPKLPANPYSDARGQR